MSRVDVIVPCYNYGCFLRECVESVLSQPVDLRVLIIDDASTDDTPQVAAELASRDNRVEVRSHPVNWGNIATFNEGLDWATGEYTLLISADDMLFPGALARATQLMDAHPEVVLTTGRVVYFESGQPITLPPTRPGEARFRISPGLEWLEDICREEGNGITTPDIVVRTSVQKRLGGYRKDLPYSGDIEMFIRFALNGSIGIIDADQALYRKHRNNMHISRDWNALNFATDRGNAFKFAFGNFGHGTEAERRLEQLAYRSILSSLLWKACKSIDQGDTSIPAAKILQFAVETTPKAYALRVYWALRARTSLPPPLWRTAQYCLKRR